MKNVSKKRVVALFLTVIMAFATMCPAFAQIGKVYTVNAKGLRLHSASTGSADADDKIVATLSKGTKVLHVATAKNWWKVRTVAGKVGYVYKTYLTGSVSGSQTAKAGMYGKVKSSSLNVREFPSTKASKLGTLHKGTVVKILAVNGSWAKISASGGKGYVKWKYLQLT